MRTPPSPVLIVGAGPTGLVLALRLAAHGMPLTLIDRRSGPGLASRAMIVQARTLEFYRQMGLGDDVAAHGIPVGHVHFRSGGKAIERIDLHDAGGDLSPYPYILAFAQDDHERYLVAQLATRGIAVQWNTELTALVQDEHGASATVQTTAGETVIEASYVCGCDGAHSTVRQALGITFPGDTYAQVFYVADVQLADGFDGDLHINLGERALALVLPVRSRGVQRLIGLIPERFAQREDITFDDIRGDVQTLAGIEVAHVNWFSRYRVHHRVADRFGRGRCFLAGDAGHIHSPAGGLGMNTGIGDAINLSWKLAAVLQGRAPAALLDTYETERIGFARQLVATTDRAFRAMAGGGWFSRLMRRGVVPTVLPLVADFAGARRTLFRTVSQIRIAYRRSAISAGRAGRTAGGDRLPWVPGDPAISAAFDYLGWQWVACGTPDPALVTRARDDALPLRIVAWRTPAEHAGLSEHAVYLVRPDGHVALAMARYDGATVDAYVARHGWRFAAANALAATPSATKPLAAKPSATKA